MHVARRAARLILALLFASAAPVAFAEPAQPSLPASPPLAPRPVSASATAALARLESEDRRFAQATAPSETPTGGSFFKTRKGAIVLVLMAVGTGYAIYSASSERIENPVR